MYFRARAIRQSAHLSKSSKLRGSTLNAYTRRLNPFFALSGMAIVMLILSLFACCLLGLYLRGRLLNNGGGGGQLHHKNAPPTTLHVIKSKSNNSNATTMPKNYDGHHYFSSHSNYNGLASYAPITPSSTTQKGGHNWLVLEQDDDSLTTAPVNTV